MELKKDWFTALFLCAASSLVSLYLGQDNNYDLRNYHVYNAWAAVAGRWSQDIFAAGAHSFFSPYLDVPYFLLATQLLPSHGAVLVALAGLPYGALLFFVYLVSRTIAGSLELAGWDRVAFIAACLLLAGTGAATWSEIGTAFNDITIGALALAALHQVLQPTTRRVAFAGGLLGLALGLKLTAAIYVLAMAVVVVSVTPGWRNRLRSLVVYGCCAGAVFVAVYGPWAWKLYSLTGNPFFPFFNGVFHSDWMASVNVRDTRFFPRSWLQWLFYPFYWTTVQSNVVTEVPFRDLRLAIAFLLVAAYVAIALASRDLREKLLAGKYRPVHLLVLFLAFSYIAWVYEFSILRYLVATECVAGILIAVGVAVGLRRLARRAPWLPALCLVSVAGLIAGYTVSPRWGRANVGADVFSVQAPAFEPGSLVIFGDAPMSFLAPGLASKGQGLHFMSIPRNFFTGGRYAGYAMEYGLGRRMKAKVAENAKSFYVLFYKSGGVPESSLATFDVRLDMESCRPGTSPLGPEFLACRGILRGH